MRRAKNKRRGGRKSPAAEYQITRMPTTEEFTSFNWIGNPTIPNFFIDDDSLAVCEGNVTSNVRLGGYNFDDYLPIDAEITGVEIIVRNKSEGTATNPRPGASIRIDNLNSTGTNHGQDTEHTVLQEFTWDVSDPVAEGLVISQYEPIHLYDGGLEITIRSANGAGAVIDGDNSWAWAKVRVTYVGAPPGTEPITTYTLTVSMSGNGSGKITSPPGLDTSLGVSAADYPQGTIVPVTVHPDPGSTFLGWTGDYEGNENPIDVLMDDDKLVDAEVNEPPPSDVIGTHAGPPVVSDFAESEDYMQIWRAVSNVFSDGSDIGNAEDDPYVEVRSGDGDWRIPQGQSEPNDSYRRLIAPEPPTQSIYDKTVHDYDVPAEQAAANTRNHLFRWTSQSSLAAPIPVMREGSRIFEFVSFRLQSPSVLAYPLSTGGGNTRSTQLIQWKCRSDSLTDVVYSLGVQNNGIRLNHNTTAVVGGSGPNIYDLIPCSLDTWHRIALEVRWSSDPGIGYYRLWGQFDAATDWTEYTPQRFGANLIDHSSKYANCGIGPYSKMSLLVGGDYYCDYANFQICNYI